MGHKTRIAVILLFLFALGAFLVLVASRQLFSRSVRGEAHLMMGYLHTLERVYHLENKRFVYWDDYYGANLKGEDRCVQPMEAAEVGFLIGGCHREKSAPPRYAYRISSAPGERYLIEAKSGSDRLGRSVVCFEEARDEVWESSQNLVYEPVESCD